MGVQSVKIPVELEMKTLESSIGVLEKALERVKPGTKIYDNLSQQLIKARKDFSSLQIAAERSYSKIGDVNAFERNFNKVTNEVQLLVKSFSSLDFSQLSFDDADLANIKELETRITNTKKELDSIRANAFKQLVADSAGIQETFKNLNLNVNTTDARKSIEKVGQEASKLREEIAKIDANIQTKAASKISDSADLSDLKNFKNIITELDDSRFFRQNKTFKNKQAFVDWGKKLGLDEESLNKLVANGAQKMAEAYSKIETEVQQKIASKTPKSNKDADAYIAKQTALRSSKLASLKQYEQSLSELQNLEVNPEVVTKINQLETALARAQEELAKMKGELVKTKGLDGVDDIKRSFGGAEQGAENARQALARFDEQARKLNSMQNAIKQWFGFNEVINLTKRTVNNAVDHIRELDKVMTEIAVVTDMTQNDLWAQIQTYSDIAQQYGVATEGVYKVSQLFYQQGLPKFFSFLKHLTFCKNCAIIRL